MQGLNEVLFGSTGPRGGKRDGVVQTMAKSTVRTVARNWREASWDRCLARRAPLTLREDWRSRPI